MGRPRKTRPADDVGGDFGNPTVISSDVPLFSTRRTLGRRALLAGTAASSLLAADVVLGGPALAATPDTPAAGGDGTLHLCVVAGTRANVDDPMHLDALARLFTAIETGAPDAVLHCGDLSDYGASDEYAAHVAAVPRALRPLLRHVPGVHEAAWDDQALHTYDRLFGRAPHSVDIDGVHVIGLNSTQLLEESGGFGAEQLDWLHRDLEMVGRRAPVLIFTHHPLGPDDYVVSDKDAFFEVIAGYNVRAVVTSGLSQSVSFVNGLVHLAVASSAAGASYYDLHRVGDDEAGDRLEVELVTLGAASAAVVTIPLAGPRVGGRLTPTWVRTTESATALGLSVRMPPRSVATVVTAQVYPEDLGQHPGEPLTLAGADGYFTGSLDLTGLPTGEHRVTIRASVDPANSVNVAGATAAGVHEQTKTFALTRGAGRAAGVNAEPKLAWTHHLPGRIQAGLAISSGSATAHVVAATTTGRVEALMVAGSAFLPEWQVTVGPVYRAPVFSPDAGTLIVGDADGTLHALAADTGASRWRANLGAPVLGRPSVISVDGRDLVVVAAARHVHARDLATGAAVWSASIGGFFAGRLGFDGTSIVTGSGDGSARAIDAASGITLWSTSVTSQETAYLKLIDGAWNADVVMLAGGLALVSTSTSTRALRVTDGSVAWSLDGNYVNTGATPIPSSLGTRDVLLVDSRGRTSRVDIARGEVRWAQTDLTSAVPLARDAAPVLRGGRAWLLGATGKLSSVRLADGVVEVTHQVSTSDTFSTPVLHDSTLIAGDQTGQLRGITLP